MKEFITSVLKTHFLYCNYAPIVIDKVKELTGGEFEIKESHTVDMAIIEVVGHFNIHMTLSPDRYIKNIYIE